MAQAGAEICATGMMWIPTQDPEAPYGCGLVQRDRVYRRIHQEMSLPDPFQGIIVQFPTHFASMGVKPFCQLSSLNEVSWSLTVEPLTGRHDEARDLAPRKTLGQSFKAPGPFIPMDVLSPMPFPFCAPYPCPM